LTNIMRPFDHEEYLEMRSYMFAGLYDEPDGYYANPSDLPSGLSLDEWMNFDETPSDDPMDMYANRLNLTGVEKENLLAGKTINWYDHVLQNGIRQDYDFSISGGTNNLRYYWSTGLTDNNGYIKGDAYKTIRSRLNVNADVSSFLNLSLNANFSDRDTGGERANLNQAVTGSPYGQIYNEDGTMAWYSHGEVVAGNPLIYYTHRERFIKTQTLFANLTGELKLPYGFSYKISFVNRYYWNRNYYFDPIETPNGASNEGNGRRTNNNIYEWQVDNLLKWNKSFADIHNFDFTFLYNAEKYQSWRDNMTNNHFAPTDDLSYHAIGAGINPSIDSNDEYSTGEALMGRLNYSLMDRYLLTLTWRRDGYSAFGQENPYGTFPSAALAWRITEEDFLNINWLDHLKVRASWGINGNRDIGRYEALARLTTTNYLYGNQLATGVYSSTMANSDLRWEKTEAINLGFDFGVIQNRLTGNIDLYSMNTKDLLMDRTLPSIVGYSSVAANLGEVANRGVELTLNADVLNTNKFNWFSSFTLSANRNEIKHLYGEMIDVVDENGEVIGQREADDWTNEWFIGESIHRIWEYDWLGVWQLDEAEEAATYGKVPGDIKHRDVNNDGELTPADDKIFQGYTEPRYRLGWGNDFSFLENFELSVFFRAHLDVYSNNTIDDQTSWIDRRNIYYADYWTPDNPSNEYARVGTDKNAPYEIWKNSSYLRMQDLTLTYNIPDDLIDKVSNFRVFVNLRNYLTFTKWDHWDPESGSSPMPKYFTLGLNMDL
ncbi:MAG: SusC/RagA family TonB-linked outer membrane protein, partial [Promethearchaeati archaeon]